MLFDPLFPLVGPVGFEPTLLLGNTVLSRASLPFRHGPKLYFIVSPLLLLAYKLAYIFHSIVRFPGARMEQHITRWRL